MRGEQRQRAHLVVQVFRHAPRDRKSVEGGRAAADLVENDERLRRGVMQNVRGLVHLDEECGLAACEIVRRKDGELTGLMKDEAQNPVQAAVPPHSAERLDSFPLEQPRSVRGSGPWHVRKCR